MGHARCAPLMSINATPRTNAVLPATFLAAHNSLLAELYVQAKASRWSLSREEFSAALYRCVAHRFGALLPREYTVEFYLRSLHVEDFALACALDRGTAWLGNSSSGTIGRPCIRIQQPWPEPRAKSTLGNSWMCFTMSFTRLALAETSRIAPGCATIMAVASSLPGCAS